MTKRTSKLKIQGRLPLRTVGIETKREQKNFSDKPPQNYIHVWFARRPTPATRLGILASVLPEDVDEDELLRWMGIDPNNKSKKHTIAEHVQLKNETLSESSGRVYDHYGYRKSYKNLPNKDELKKLHDSARDVWGGDLPTILDATAGGGSIPFESSRYNFPTIANELNPVPSVILKAILEHPRVDGDLSSDIEKWGNKINDEARDRLSEYYPGDGRKKDLEYIWANRITCPDCGSDVPLTLNWWLERETATKGVAVQPEPRDDSNEVDLSIVRLPHDVTKDEFNPTSGTVTRGKGTCPSCNVTIGGDEVKEQAQSGEMDIQLMAVHYESRVNGKRDYREPTSDDVDAINKAQEAVDSNPETASFLDVEIEPGSKTNEPRRYGMTEWRDMYSPRQLLAHYTYWKVYDEYKTEIREQYSSDEADVILTFLSLAADKAADYNSKMCTWVHSAGKIGHAFAQHDFGFKWRFAESRLPAEGLGYDWVLDSMVEVYEELEELAGHASAPLQIYQGDAANLSLDDGEVEVIVLDPPYYDNVMYAELSDYFYVLQKQYLSDVYPEFFLNNLTDKQDEAVANPEKFEGLASSSASKSDLAKDDYESKMASIFSEMHRVLSDSGIFTLMFTHKKTEAWDTLTTALIKAGFVVTATHPVSTERPDSLHQKGKNSAESTILLSTEKRQTESDDYTLWEEIQGETRRVAKDQAHSLDQGGVDFSKVDIILAAFGPTLEVFTKSYPVVDDEGNEVTPQTALDEARSAVRDYLIEQYLNSGIREVDHKTEWYVLAWLVFEAQRFPYDEGRRLAIGIGENLDSLKKTHRMWRKKSGDVVLRPHGDRVRDVNKDRDNRSGRKPVDPDALSFSTALDKVHAAMHVYDAKGATEAWNWMNDRNCGSDPSFKATFEALLRVLPHDHEDWKLARDIAAGETGELLDLDLDADIFRDDDDEDDDGHQGNLNDF